MHMRVLLGGILRAGNLAQKTGPTAACENPIDIEKGIIGERKQGRISVEPVEPRQHVKDESVRIKIARIIAWPAIRLNRKNPSRIFVRRMIALANAFKGFPSQLGTVFIPVGKIRS